MKKTVTIRLLISKYEKKFFIFFLLYSRSRYF